MYICMVVTYIHMNIHKYMKTSIKKTKSIFGFIFTRCMGSYTPSGVQPVHTDRHIHVHA